MTIGIQLRHGKRDVDECSTFAPKWEAHRLFVVICGSTTRPDDARVGAQHAVDVGPDLDHGCVQRGADDRGAVIRSVAPMVVVWPSAVGR